MNHLPIGLFDSGMGGLTVLREVASLLPNEHLIYLGDTARLPYGNKSPEAIVQFALDNADFLLQQKIKLLIISCHTACSYAFERLQKTLPIPVLGVTMPGLQALVETTKSREVAVLGTQATIASGLFQCLLKERGLITHPIACPLFVPLVEEGLQNHSAAKIIAQHYLAPLLATKVDAVLLACTHYPLLKTILREVLGPEIQLIEPARATAMAARTLLEEQNLLNQSTATPSYQFYASDDPEKFRHLAKLFFPYSIERVSLRAISPCKK
jgi:glutamate racemase